MAERMFAVVRFRRAGFHYWPNPGRGREYLGENHRHLFHVEVSLEVHHDEREVEFHDLLEFAERVWPMTAQLRARSCETLARELAESILNRYPGRALRIEVAEDGEVAARLESDPA